MAFDYRRGRFTLTYRHDERVAAPTEVFVPPLQYPRGYHVSISDGSYAIEREQNIVAYRHSHDRPEHTIAIDSVIPCYDAQHCQGGPMRELPRARTIIEPFRIKSVEPIRLLSPAERGRVLEEAGYNLFKVRAQDVTFDLLTDSGTSAMSARQWAGIMVGDESYAGSPSFQRFEKSVQDLTGMENVVPTHQGRSAEFLLMQALALKAGDIVAGNTHFDTTRANIEHSGAQALDLPCPETADTQSEAPFKGNIDLPALARLVEKESHRVRLVIMTATNNSVGGQPVSMENIGERAVSWRAAGSRFFSTPHVSRRTPSSSRSARRDSKAARCARSRGRCSPSATAPS